MRQPPEAAPAGPQGWDGDIRITAGAAMLIRPAGAITLATLISPAGESASAQTTAGMAAGVDFREGIRGRDNREFGMRGREFTRGNERGVVRTGESFTGERTGTAGANVRSGSFSAGQGNFNANANANANIGANGAATVGRGGAGGRQRHH